MRPTVLVLLGLACAVVGALVLDLMRRRGLAPLPLPRTTPLVLLLLAAAVLGAAREVRRWVAGRPNPGPRGRGVNPIAAARIAVLAVASAYVGAMLTGWYAAQALVLAQAFVGARRVGVLVAAVTAAASAVLALAGWLGQRWCLLPPDGPGDGPPGGTTP